MTSIKTTFRENLVHSLVRLGGRLGRPVALAMAACLALAPHATAQERAGETWLVVTADGAPLRAGHAEAWYEAARLERGQALRAVGRRADWRAVRFPDGVPALVSASEVEEIREGDSVRLIEPSRLLVWNVTGDPLDAFRALMDQALPSGTELDVMRAIERDGQVAWYLVEPPAGAQAFIHDRFVRPATEEEARRFSGRAPEEQAGRAGTDAADEPGPEPQDAAPASVAPSRETKPAPVDIAPEFKIEGRPETNRPSEPDRSNQDRTRRPEPTPQGEDQAAADPAPEDPFDRKIATFRELESAFREVVEQPILEAELGPLTAEFRRLLRSIGNRDEDASLRAAAQSRIELLGIRAELQEDMRRLAELEAQASESASEIAQRVESLRRNNVTFDAVGRLATSSIYDGKRLPLMYRLQSVDSAGGRTIAYVAPGPEDAFDLAGRIGAIIGVIGEARTDPALRMDIIRPKRVDTLTTATYRSADAMDESDVDAISR